MENFNERSGERGNVLFLILIAVALFAALSYAVTQSTRSGGGSTEREQALLGSSTMTQYPTALRTSVIRMILGGIGVEQLYFNPPSDFTGQPTDQLVFHPVGGGATFQASAADVMAGAAQGTWYYNANFEVPQIGITDDAGGSGADLIAFLPGVKSSVCQRANDELGVDTSSCTTEIVSGVGQAELTDANITDLQDDTYTFPTSNQEDLECTGGTAYTGQASGCFYDLSMGQYIFYSVLLER